MRISSAQVKRFKALKKQDQSGSGIFGDIVKGVKRLGKAVVKGGVELIKFTVKGVRAISGLLEDAGIPPSDQVAFLAWMSGQKEYAKTAKALAAASVALKQAGRGDDDKKEISVDVSKSVAAPAAEQGHRPRPSGSTPARKVDLSADNVIQLADPNADQPYDTNKELPQLALPNASLGSVPLFGDMSGAGRARAIKGTPRAWGNSSQGNVIAATSDASPQF